MLNKIRVAVVGATGVVGRTILKVLEEENLPIDEYSLFASHKSKGSKVDFMNQPYSINELNFHSFDSGFSFAIFSAGADVAKKFAPIANENGCIVIDNSSAFRMDDNVPLVVPEVNSQDASSGHGIIANPNCSTIQAVVALKPLDLKYKIKRVVYSTYQAVSGAGRNGILDLENGIYNYAEKNVESNYELKKFDYPIFNNCLPHIDSFLSNGYTKEEMKMINETRKILHSHDLPITATAVRVPVFNSHGESINIEFENDYDIVELVRALHDFPGIVIDDLNYSTFSNSDLAFPIATKVTGHNDVHIGRIRRDFSVKSGINLWCVADNIRKGAASNAVQILKLLINNN